MNINIESVATKMDKSKSYLDYYEQFGSAIVEECAGDLDDVVNRIKNYMQGCDKADIEYDVPSLEQMSMELSSNLYYTRSKFNRVSLLENMTSIEYKSKYNDAYLNKQADHDAGTKYSVEQLRNFAEQQALEEKLINFIYEHAADEIKGKVEAADNMLKIVSKCLSAQIERMKTFNVGNKYS